MKVQQQWTGWRVNERSKIGKGRLGNCSGEAWERKEDITVEGGERKMKEM